MTGPPPSPPPSPPPPHAGASSIASLAAFASASPPPSPPPSEPPASLSPGGDALLGRTGTCTGSVELAELPSMPLIISRTCSSVLPTIGSIVNLSFLLVTATSGDARNLDISVGVLVDISSRASLSCCVALCMHETVTRDSTALAGRTPCSVTFCIAHQPSIVVQNRVRYILSSRISTLAVR